jgi:N-acetylmuramoyl-L-alanine amidase
MRYRIKGLIFSAILYSFLLSFLNVFKTNAASALAAWQVTSDGTLKFRTTPYADLEAYYQSGYGQKGDRIWIDFPGELTQPRKLIGNGPIQEIRLGKPYKGNTRLVVEFDPQVSLNPSKLRLLGTSPNLWELRFDGINLNGLKNIGEGSLIKPARQITSNRSSLKLITKNLKDYQPSSLPTVQRGRFHIVIDPGHGGPDSGAVGINGLKETDVVLDISRTVARYLGDKGVKVLMTRSNEIDVGLNQRVLMANRSNADAFVSIHANATRGFRREVSGIESYFFTGFYGKKLASKIQDELLHVTPGSPDRGVRQSRFFVIRKTNMPATLIEVGFVTGRFDAKLLAQRSHRRKVAFAISKGILNYLKESY